MMVVLFDNQISFALLNELSPWITGFFLSLTIPSTLQLRTIHRSALSFCAIIDCSRSIDDVLAPSG